MSGILLTKEMMILLSRQGIPTTTHSRCWYILVGAGLRTFRKVGFDIAVFDEASQITEPCALIPLVKRMKRAMMVGDQFVHYSLFFFKKKKLTLLHKS